MREKRKLKWLGLIAAVVLLGFAFLMPQMAQATPKNEGQIVYVEVTTRVDGEITACGNLKVKNLDTNRISTVIDNSTDNCIILNPTFTSDGENILFTAGDGDPDDYKVFLVSSQSDSVEPSDLTPLKEIAGSDLKYAALSFDSDGSTTGTLAYTKDGTTLCRYDFSSGINSERTLEAGLVIRDIVFLDDNDTVAYIGTKNGIQDIYTISITTGVITKHTVNVSPTPKYGRLSNSVRATGIDYLIYSKSEFGSFDYEKWDICIYDLVTDSETKVTNTPSLDEYDPAFYGDTTTDPDLDANDGDMFYSANDEHIWQTNYDTVTPANSNMMKTERTLDDAGLANWGPVIAPYTPASIALEDTRIIFSNGTELSHAEVTATGTTTDTVQITPTGTNVNPSLSGTGGTIVYGSTGETKIDKINHDGSGGSTLVPSSDVRQPNFSKDGRWVVYIEKTGAGDVDGDLKMCYIASDGTVTPLDPGLSLTNAANPVFNSDMTQIVYEDTGTAKGIYVVSVTLDNDTPGVTAGTPVQILASGTYNDKYPSYSPDGEYIIFTSDRWDAEDNIFVMNAKQNPGTGITKAVANASLTVSTPAIFGPVEDDEDYYIAYVETGGEIQIATLPKDLSTLALPLASKTGITPTGKFSWGISRVKGSVVVTRTIQSKAVTGAGITYQLTVDVDEASVPSAYTISEVLPNWILPTGVGTDVVIDGVPASAGPTNLKENFPVAGQNTLNIVFFSLAGAPNDDVTDHIIKITVTTAGTSGDVKTLSGTVVYGSSTDIILGDSAVLIGNPFMPIDLYNYDGTSREDTDTGIIDNLDLLYGIDCWATDAQLTGPNGLWPADTEANWDAIILDVIDIWADTTYQGEYLYDTSTVTNPDIAHEMYWTAGTWVE